MDLYEICKIFAFSLNVSSIAVTKMSPVVSEDLLSGRGSALRWLTFCCDGEELS